MLWNEGHPVLDVVVAERRKIVKFTSLNGESKDTVVWIDVDE